MMQNDFTMFMNSMEIYYYTNGSAYSYISPTLYSPSSPNIEYFLKIEENKSVQQFSPKIETDNSSHHQASVRPVETSYERKKKRIQKRCKLQSAKKNSESNLVSHTIRFFAKNPESQHIVLKAIERLRKPLHLIKNIRDIFFHVLRLIRRKRQRKYINRKSLICFFTRDKLMKQLPFLQQKLREQNIINGEELCYLYRICFYYHLRNISPLVILASKRIEGRCAKEIHLNRLKTIINQLFTLFSEQNSEESEWAI